MTSKKASDFYKNLLDENQDVIFDTRTQNGKPVNYESVLRTINENRTNRMRGE